MHRASSEPFFLQDADAAAVPDRVITEERNPATLNIDLLPTLEILRLINAEDAKVAAAVERELPQIALAVDAVASRLLSGGRLIYFGAGTSGRIALLDAAECPPTFGIEPDRVIAFLAGGADAFGRASEDAEDDAEAGRRDVAAAGVKAADAVVGVSASGRSPYVLAAVEAARKVGSLTIGLACQYPSRLAEMVDIRITPVVGPEVIAGSTRMKAGTAQKMVLNMLSTAVMIRLGKVYSNLMVDLQPTNAKLRERACRIVSQVAGVSLAEAAQALAQANYSPKLAIVMLRLGVSVEEARRRLDRASGFLREVLDGKR